MTKTDETFVYIDPSDVPGGQWQPTLGIEGEDFVSRQVDLEDHERQRLVAEAQSILGACQPPGDQGHRTVLAVGRVQSGKTLSFEMLTVLARDNGFGLVIIVAGISKFLEKQTRRRLEGDLALNDPSSHAFEKWLLLSSAQLMQGDDLGLPGLLNTWSQRGDGAAEDDPPPTAIVVTLKHYQHIDAVAEIIPGHFGVPTLIIDDEADQASLNARTRRPDRPPTTTFSALASLRARLPSHSYVQYTATPQANLLLAAADTLAPDAVRMLTPGSAYVGNEDFFTPPARRVRRIADEEAAVFDPQVTVTEPPQSLLAAIDSFMVAAALGRYYGRCDGRTNLPAQLSMLVHPERLVSEHSKASRWVEARVHLLRNLDDDALASTLEDALSELRATAVRDDFPDTMTDVVSHVRKTLDLLGVLVLNRGDEGWSATGGEDLPWNTKYAWIVVGGQMVDRGLTIPGLAVTYIPRSPSQNIDTGQQRARWLGYKRSFLDRCRLWMTEDTTSFFTDYSEHELEMHREVQRIVTDGIALKDWRRQFLLDPQWRLTRSSVISRSLQSHRLQSWESFLSLGAGDEPNAEARDALDDLDAFVRALPGFDGGAEHGHTWCDCTLREAFEAVDLYPVHDADDADDKALLLGHIARRIDGESPDAEVARIYLMDDLDLDRPRERSVDPDADPVRIKSLLQGRNARYPGDREIVRRDGENPALTLQLHRVLPTRVKRGGPPLWADGATTIALSAYIPPGTDPGWVIEAS